VRWAGVHPLAEDGSGDGRGTRRGRWARGTQGTDGSGDRVCIIGVGKMLAPAIEAAEILVDDGIDATVWDPRIVKPLDPTMLQDAARHAVVVTIEDGFREGGAGTGIQTALEDLEARCRVEVMGVPIEYIQHAAPDVILTRMGLDASGIVETVRRIAL